MPFAQGEIISMAGILDSVNQRTQLVGQNRLELLLFRLVGNQRFGINVFKVKEVLQCPKLTTLPKLNSVVRGVSHIRGQTISIIDMSRATGGPPIQDLEKAFVIIAEYNRSVQGFLVGSVERIINMNWENIMPPPQGAGKFNYLTAVTEVEKELVSILDVEKILDEISPFSTEVSDDITSSAPDSIHDKKILVADDSSVARNQVKRAVTSLGIEVDLCKDGKEALDLLKAKSKDADIYDIYSLIISDIEMPEMDGYTLTAAIRSDPALNKLKIILHTSLSGVFNQAMVDKVGANAFIAKFNPDELATAVRESIEN